MLIIFLSEESTCASIACTHRESMCRNKLSEKERGRKSEREKICEMRYIFKTANLEKDLDRWNLKTGSSTELSSLVNYTLTAPSLTQPSLV